MVSALQHSLTAPSPACLLAPCDSGISPPRLHQDYYIRPSPGPRQAFTRAWTEVSRRAPWDMDQPAIPGPLLVGYSPHSAHTKTEFSAFNMAGRCLDMHALQPGKQHFMHCDRLCRMPAIPQGRGLGLGFGALWIELAVVVQWMVPLVV